MMAFFVVLMLTECAHGLSARAWVSAGRDFAPPLIIGGGLPRPLVGQKLGITLLDFSTVPMLPGDEQEILVTQETSRALLEHAASEHQACCGQLLLGDGGQLIGVCGLLEAERLQPVDTWRLRCVGRIQLEDAWQAEQGGFVCALATPFVDDEEDTASDEEDMVAALAAALSGDEDGVNEAATKAWAKADAAEVAARAVAASAEANGVSREAVVAAATEMLRNMDAEIRRAHSSLVDQRTQLLAALGDDEATSSSLAMELRALGDERGKGLNELVSSRRSRMLESIGSVGKRVGPHPSGFLGGGGGGSGGESVVRLEADGAQGDEDAHYALEVLWGSSDEEVVARQLTSFAAAAMLPEVRMHALCTSSTTERLSAALCALRAQERRMGALLALHNAQNGE